MTLNINLTLTSKSWIKIQMSLQKIIKDVKNAKRNSLDERYNANKVVDISLRTFLLWHSSPHSSLVGFHDDTNSDTGNVYCE